MERAPLPGEGARAEAEGPGRGSEEAGEAAQGGGIGVRMDATALSLKVVYPSGRRRQLPLYDSSKSRGRGAVVYMVKTLSDGVRLAFNRDYKLLGSVQATTGEWEAALIHSLDTCPEYSVNDRVPGDAVWFEACGEAREPYRRSWIEGCEWGEEREG